MARLINRPRGKRANSSNNSESSSSPDTSPVSPRNSNSKSRKNDNNNNNALCIVSRQNVSMLMIGMMLGYIVLPLLMVQKIPLAVDNSSVGFEKYQRKYKKNDSHIKAVKPLDASEVSAEGEYMLGEEGEEEYIDIVDKQRQESNSFRGAVVKTSGGASPSISKPSKQSNLEKLKSRVMFTEPNTPELLSKRQEDEEAAIRIVENFEVLSHQSIPTSTTPQTFHTQKLPANKRLKILVTGGAGFVGSHLVDKLMVLGHEVIVLDNFFTGQKQNVEHWSHHPHFSMVTHDVIEPIMLEVDQIYHLACPASPPHYQYNPIKTIKTSTMGTLNMLGLAKRIRARMLLTSTSEVYGDPKEHPQKETYWGNVNTIGPRSCYDEGKRVAETMMYSYKEQAGVEVRVARIFNTFGPRMHPNDGRVVSNFIIQALQGKPLTVYGDGSNTRSFQYVSDLVEGLYALMNGDYDKPVNLGNPDEYSIKNFADYIKSMTNSTSEIRMLPASEDDPSQRRPDINVAKENIGWQPKVHVKDGLEKTIAYFSGVLRETGEIIPTGPGASKPEA